MDSLLRLTGKLKQYVYLMPYAKNELEQLHVDLNKLETIYTTASTMYADSVKKWESEVREAVCDIEDTIDTRITYMVPESVGKTNPFKRHSSYSPRSVAKMVETARKKKLQHLLEASLVFHDRGLLFHGSKADTTDVHEREFRQKKPSNIVGFEDEAEQIINFLCGDSKKLEIASIVGMAGLGKTALAWKIFDSPCIKYEFPLLVWVDVSEDLNMTNVMCTIYRCYTHIQLPISVEKLSWKVRDLLKEQRFLIILDDICTVSAWDKIKEILPIENPRGRVLVTTRHNDVAEYSSTQNPHYLRFLTDIESWQLLQYELNVVPPSLEDIGKAIAVDCGGLPLSVVVIGLILLEKQLRAGTDINLIRDIWQKVSCGVNEYLMQGDYTNLFLSIISRSYENISFELKNCFMYFGVFPKRTDISVKELVRLWIAEGFIQETRWDTLEEVALDNLKELINRNLVMVKEEKLDGEPKICQVHDSVHELCKVLAKYENMNFFEELSESRSCYNVEKFRRLCIHSHVLSLLKRNITEASKARSFICYQKSPIILKPTEMSFGSASFGLLRVYNAKYIKFPIFPKKLVHLSLLRYLTLVVEQCTSLPEAISELLNLQTLMVYVTSSTLDIKADIWKMNQLRHLKTKASMTLKNAGRGDGGDNLQTLSRLSPESCTNEVFQKANNLVTLGIQGELSKLVSFECFRKLEELYKLKLVNEMPNKVAAENPLPRLPDPQYFPPKLKILVLSGTYICWEMISTLSNLRFLEVLKLKKNAFVGYYWDAKDTFQNLEHLHIDRQTDLVYWKASDHNFPRMRFLSLNKCDKLIEVPYALCKNLQTLCIEHATKDLVSYANSIAKDRGMAFKLNIVPKEKIED